MITLLSDFGTSDYFVAAMKGAILAINPNVAFLDITHAIPPQDIETAAFTLGACYREFPPGTIHLAIVDPGVGSARRAIVVEAGGQRFVGPDNGVFSFVYFHEPQRRVRSIAREDLFRRPLSPTFHGRDLFAPVAAHLSANLSPEEIGPEIHDYVRFDLKRPRIEEAGNYRGSVIHIDRFGNCVTNFTQEDFSLDRVRGCARLWIANQEVTEFGSHYAVASDQSSMLAYPGSAGYWEVAVQGGSAAEKTGARRGTEVLVEIKRRSAGHEADSIEH